MILPALKIKRIKKMKDPQIDADLVLKAVQQVNIPPNIKWQIDGTRLILKAQEMRLGSNIINPLNKNVVNRIQREFKNNIKEQLSV